MSELDEIREKKPLVHCITNYVTVNDVANAILAFGGSPIMADDIAEVSSMTSISNALLLNIGTLNERTIASMKLAGITANSKGVPVILDPVGAGSSTFRNGTVLTLLSDIHFSIIKGNLSELSFLAGLGANTRGVDSCESDQQNNTTEVAKNVAKKYQTTVVLTGYEDIVTDGHRVAKITNGVSLMNQVTGTGCMLGGLLGVSLGAGLDTFHLAVLTVSAMGIAGEMAYEQTSMKGTGSFHISLIDFISQMNDSILNERSKIVYETEY